MEGLTQLGLNEYEARAYAALLAHPGSTGYEVAGHSGVPRGRIYDALGGLAAKGAAHTSREGDRTLYHPVDHDTLLRRHRERAGQLAAMLGPALAPPEAANRLGNALPALVVAADQSEALLAHMAPDRPATGMWTRNSAVVLVAAKYIRHDIFVAETYQRLSEPAQRQLAMATRDLQEMWFCDLTYVRSGDGTTC